VQTNQIANATSSALILLNIVNNILDFTEAQKGIIDLQIERFHLKKLLERIINIFKNVIKKKKLQCSLTIAENVPLYIKSSPRKISQILINLIQNSLKFTQKGKIQIIVNKKLPMANPKEKDVIVI
jgi:hypothetical protein